MAGDAHALARTEAPPAGAQPQHEGLINWLVDNVAVPVYDQGIVEPVNAAANVINGVTFHHVVGKLDPVELQQPTGTLSEYTQMISGGVASYLPIAVLSGLLHTKLEASTAGLAEPLAKIGASQTTSLMLSAAAFDAARDVHPGETRLSNVVSGVVGFGILGAGASATARWSLLGRMAVANPLIGAASAEAQLATSSLMTGNRISEQQMVASATSGAVFNSILPAINMGFDRALGGRARVGNQSNEGAGTVRNAGEPYLDVHGRDLDQVLRSIVRGETVHLPETEALAHHTDVETAAQTVKPEANVSLTADAGTAEPLSRAEAKAPLTLQEMPGLAKQAFVGLKESGALSTDPHLTGPHDDNLIPRQKEAAFFSNTDAETGLAADRSAAASKGEHPQSTVEDLKPAVVPVETTVDTQKVLVKGTADTTQSGTTDSTASATESDAKLEKRVASGKLESKIGNPLVIGAGGAKIYEAIGALMAMRDLKIPFGDVTGVSAGGDAAAAITNGMSPEQLLKLTLDSRAKMYDPGTFMEALKLPALGSWGMDSWISLENLWQQEVEKLGWKPNDRLRLVSAYKDPADGSYKPYVFKGTNYNLGKALAATGAYPGVFAPVQIGDKSLVDGGMYHFNPVLPGTKDPSIVLRLNLVTEMPQRLQFPWVFFPTGESILPPFVERALYARELFRTEPVPNTVDANRNAVIDLKTDVPGLNFWLSEDKALEMVKDGYRQAVPQLKAALKAGKIFASPSDTKPRVVAKSSK